MHHRSRRRSDHRRLVYGIRDNIPAGPAYPIRTISDGQHRYIRNLLPDEIYIEKHLMGLAGGGSLNNPYWATWVREAWTNRHTYDLVKRYMRRPAEPLYHTANDPYEMQNMADEPACAAIKQRLANELDRWLASQGDPGIAQDTSRALEAARRGEHLYGSR